MKIADSEMTLRMLKQPLRGIRKNREALSCLIIALEIPLSEYYV